MPRHPSKLCTTGIATEANIPCPPAPEMVEGFNDSMREMFPMTPHMIARYRGIYEAQRRATLERPEPKARVTTGMATLGSGEKSPVVPFAP